MTTSTSKASAASTRNHRNLCMLLPCTDTNPCMLLPCTPDRHRSHHTHPPSHPSLFTLSITTTLDALSDTRRVYRVVYLSPPRVPDAFAHTRSLSRSSHYSYRIAALKPLYAQLHMAKFGEYPDC
jgi:hypothetical protein